MATLSLTSTGFHVRIADFILWRSSRRAERPEPAPKHQIEQARRDFIDDMLSRNSEAFASEQDVQSMMFVYPGRI